MVWASPISRRRGNGRLGDVLLPLADRLLGLLQELHLGRVVVHGLAQAGDQLVEAGTAPLIRRQEVVPAGQQVAAHAGLHVYRGGQDGIGMLDHLVGVGHPLLVGVHYDEIAFDLGRRRGGRRLAFGDQVRFDLGESGDLLAQGVEELLARPLSVRPGTL